MAGPSFFMDVAASIAGFFKYLSSQKLYDKDKASKIEKIARHYKKQYSRVHKLWSAMYKYVEKDTNDLMALDSAKEYDTKLRKLQDEAKDFNLMEVGYVYPKEYIENY